MYLMPIVLTIGLFLFLLFAQEVYRRVTPIAWFTFLVLPIVLLPFWLNHDDFNWFMWAKIYSVTLGCCVILLYRFTKLGEGNEIKLLLWLILALNIAEAVVQDAVDGGLPHYLNALAGVLLIFTIPRIKHLSIDKTSRFRDMLWDMPMTWILGYTFWNWLFVYLNWHDAGGRHMAVLGAPLVIALFVDRKRWMQTRAFTLATYVLIKFSFDPFLEKYMPMLYLYNDKAALLFSVFTISWMSLYTIKYFSNYLGTRQTVKHYSLR